MLMRSVSSRGRKPTGVRIEKQERQRHGFVA
jgi:hypothetical protein